MSAWAVTRGAGATIGSCIGHVPFHAEVCGIGPKGIMSKPEIAKHNSRVRMLVYCTPVDAGGSDPLLSPAAPLPFLPHAARPQSPLTYCGPPRTARAKNGTSLPSVTTLPTPKPTLHANDGT